MNYPQVGIENASEELNRLHAEIEGKMRSTVQDAIRAGEILSQVKERLSHGDFLPWIKLNCRFTERTAQNYMRLNAYRNKCESVADLQEAYRQVETLEAQERKTDDQKARERVTAFVKTGKKAEGWRRGTDDKLAEEQRERDIRFEAQQEEWKRKSDERIKQSEKSAKVNTDEFADLRKYTDALAADMEKRATWKEKIRISHEGKDDPFIDALIDYMDTLADDNRRTEACYNIIKACKGIVHGLGKASA